VLLEVIRTFPDAESGDRSHREYDASTMPDYIYLLENRLSAAQQNALRLVRDAARAAGMTVFLTGGAVRDLTSGFPVRDLDFSVQGNALKLRKPLEKAGATLWGEHEASHSLFFWFPGSVRVEVSSSRREEYPRPGKPVYHLASIHEDLRRRDFTANAMAISLNEGSWGLLLDPLNGFADIEGRHLRLASNYGFIEDPSRLVRAIRFAARTGWTMEPRTQTRYENAKDENLIEQISPWARGYELEEIAHEEDPLKALQSLEAEGWMKALCPAWTAARADTKGLDELNRIYIRLLMLGVSPDPSAAHIQLLTAKLSPKDIASLKHSFSRPGFVEQWNHLDDSAREFSKELLAKSIRTPSATWKLLVSYQPEAVLWLAFSSKNPQVQEKFNQFFNVWPEARQKIPIALMAEMRIVPELADYGKIAEELFFRLMDGDLQTEEAIRAFLEPFSPPAPPPPVVIRRPRGRRAEPRFEEEEEEETSAIGDSEDGDEDQEEDHEVEELPEILPPPRTKRAAAKSVSRPAAEEPAAKKPAEAVKPEPQKLVAKESKKAPAQPAEITAKAPVQPAKPTAKTKAAAKTPAQPEKAAPKTRSAARAAAPAKSAPKTKPAKKPQSKPARTVAKPLPKKQAAPSHKPAKSTATRSATKPTARKVVKPAKPVAKDKKKKKR
jgi:tRNA nucleotidyltransferase/poly(A) polymerase